MSKSFDTLALYDSLTQEERAELDRAMEKNPALAEAFVRWNSLRASIRRELAADLPDRSLLVLYALADGDADLSPEQAVLDADDRARMEAAQDDLRIALDRHPGLIDAVRRIHVDRQAFEHAWQAHSKPDGSEAGAVNPPEADRRPMRLIRADRSVRWGWRVAALIVIVLGGTVLVQLARRDAGFQTIRATELMAVDLPDGSSIDLAEGAILMIPENGRSERHARLMAGNALFDILHDEANPFNIETPNAVVTVLGTTFGLEVTDIQTEVVLANGVVELSSRAAPDAPVRLESGQRSRVLALDLPTEPALADVNAALSWSGDLFIRSESMSRVAEYLSETFGKPLEVHGTLASEVVSGTRFEREAGLEAAVQELALSLGARVEPLDGGGFHITP